ncbi:MAG: hypothetical protein Q4D07_01685 [Selenomonadaceae bacterium]|nr:hypothetical protein [Selenomonadaceae bacterium]
MANTDVEKAKVLYLLQGLQLEQKDNDMLNQYLTETNYELAVVWLRKKRVSMLAKLHEIQKAIDDLDLIVYQLRKLGNERTERK